MNTRLFRFLWCSLCVVYAALLSPEARDDTNGCDQDFKDKVEECLHALRGFPVLAPNKTFVSGDWLKTDVICRWELVSSASGCVRKVYGQCPRSHALRSLCGFNSVQPDLLLRYGQSVCKHRKILEQHWGYAQSRHCSLKACLDRYRPSLPSAMTVGMLKSPAYSAYCSYQAYVEFCHETVMVPDCPWGFCEAHLEIMRAVRPWRDSDNSSSSSPACAEEQIALLKERYLQYHRIRLDAGSAAASMLFVWSHGSHSLVLIVGWVFWGDVF